MVVALWSISACWIAFELAVPPHRTEELLWRASGALALTAAASSTMIMWYLARVQIEPAQDERRAFRIGYSAGYHDAEKEHGPGPGSLHLVPRQCNEDNSRTG